MKKKIYVACALTQAPEEFQQDVAALKSELKHALPDVEILEFIGTVLGTPSEVYQWDIHHCVQDCDLLVAICDYPAIGLGYELGVAIEKLHKPVIVAANQGTKITRLLLGISDSLLQMFRYKELSELVPVIASRIASV